MKVVRLPAEVVDRIAAGEVVERPASALKELVENSLDAGARRIHVHIRDGGRHLAVVDDGCGMEEEDLLLALERHATSKLRSVDDLWRIQTLGFRGEALPSIAAVSRMEIRTRTREAAVGWRLVVEGGLRRLVAEVSHAPGTAVTVRDLFFNTPARLQFLKRPETEVAKAVEAVERLAVAYPAVAFTVEVEDRTSFRTGGSGNRLMTLADLWGSELALSLLSVEGRQGEAVLHLLLAPAGEGRSSRAYQYVFVNGRPVHAPRLRFALEEAYRERLMKGRYPVFCLDLTLPPEDVDPNVHPQKLEVRLRHESQLASFVHELARRALSPRPTPAVKTPGVAETERVDTSCSRRTAEPGRDEAPRSVREPFAAYEENHPGSPPEAVVWTEASPPAPRLIGRLAGAYILAEGAEGLYIVDQHAAHERVTYERLQRKEGGIQMLVAPMVLRLTPEEMAAVETGGRALAELGLEVTPIGAREVAVRSVPVSLGRSLSAEDVHRALRSWTEARGDGEAARRALVACRSSVKAGTELTPPEMEALLRSLFRAEEPRFCPHGRPTFFFLPLAELERRLGRR